MGFLLISLTVFLLSVQGTGAMFEWIPPATMCDSVHHYKPTPYNGVPPPMPKLPNQYTMSIQANILQKAWSSETVEYYDGPNNRAAVFLTFNGTTTQTIFNYHTMETYDIYPDGSCKARGGMADYFGFFKMDKNHRPAKATVYQMFHMGPKQNFTYVGNTWVRGIRVNHWTSCQEWSDFGAKFQLDYYFSHADYQTAWGTGQIPVRAVVNGSAGNSDQNHQHMFGRHKFEHIYDFTTFNVGPIKDETVFQQPHDVVCTGRRDFKSMPQIPDNFQMDMEMNCPVTKGSMPFHHSLRYDWDHRLVETHMNIPSPQGSMLEIKKKMMENQGQDMHKLMDMNKMVMRAMNSIDDHNTGLRYVTEKTNNTCRVMPIPNEKEAVPMDHGRSLFNIHVGQKTGQSPFTYQGKSTFRNIPVDVWGMDGDGMIQKVFFLADGREPTLLKNKDDASNPWSGANWNSGSAWKGSSEENAGSKPKPTNPVRPRPTNIPNANQKPSRGPFRPKPTDGGPRGPRPSGSPIRPRPSGSPNGPRPSGSPNGPRPSGSPNGMPKPTAGNGMSNRPGLMNAINNLMKAKQEASSTNSSAGNAAMGAAQKRMMEMFQKRKEMMEGNSNSNSQTSDSGEKGMMPMPSQMTPYPVLVGMVFRNRTAISTRSMPSFFQEVMQPELIRWKEQMAKDYLDGMKNQKTEGETILDKHAMMQQMHNRVMRKAGEMDMNVFHFQPLHTDDTMFQVSHCYEPEQTSHVLLHVPTSFKTNVQSNQAAFSLAMRKGIAEAMGVSYLHVSNLVPEPHIDIKKNIDSTYVSFSLLGSPPVKAPRMKPPSISEAKRRLVQAIKNGISFKVNYPTHTKSFLVDSKQYAVDRKVFQMPAQTAPNVQNLQTGNSGSSDYSGASVAGIAIGTLLLGFVLAAAVIFLLHKRKHPDEPVIPYKITKE